MGQRSSAREDIRQALVGLGFDIVGPSEEVAQPRPDLVARRGPDSYVVEIKSQAPFRKSEFLGTVAHGILALQEQQAPGRDLKPLLAVWFENARPNAAAEFESYVGRHAPWLNWLMVDASGWRKWKVAGEQGEEQRDRPELDRPPRAQPAKSNLFAPRHQWMLKVLLLPGLDRKYWSGPDRQPASVSALAAGARVAKSHAWNLVALLEQRGYLRRDDRRFQFPGLRRLLEDWCAFVRLKPDRVIGAVPVHPERSAEKSLAGVLARLRAPSHAMAEPGPGAIVLGGHRACHVLGLGRSNLQSVRLYVEKAADALRPLALVPADGNAALLEIVEPKARDSVFRAAIRRDGLGVADVLQLYVDLRSSPARGVEQSDFLFERVLEPHFRRAGWL